MNREIHVRICEGLRGKFPRPTRLCILTIALTGGGTPYREVLGSAMPS